jgi:hypothetical protein
MYLLNTVEPPLVSCIFFLQIAKNSSMHLLNRAFYCTRTFQLSDRKEPKVIFNAAKWPRPRPISRKPSLLFLAAVLLVLMPVPYCCWRPNCCWSTAVVGILAVVCNCCWPPYCCWFYAFAGSLLLLASRLLLVPCCCRHPCCCLLLLLASRLLLVPSCCWHPCCC